MGYLVTYNEDRYTDKKRFRSFDDAKAFTSYLRGDSHADSIELSQLSGRRKLKNKKGLKYSDFKFKTLPNIQKLKDFKGNDYTKTKKMAKKKRKSARYTASLSVKGGVTALFMKSSTGIVWAKRFRSTKTLARAKKGLAKVGSKIFAQRKAKGFKFGAVLKRMNASRKRK